MNRRTCVAWLLPIVFALLALAPRDAHAADKKVLFVTINGHYNSNGALMYGELAQYVEQYHGVDGLTDHHVLTADNQVAALLQQNTYEQIWVYDLSRYADDYPNDYAAIAAWYARAPLKEVICDGRYLSSFYLGRTPTEGRAVTQNYYYNMAVRGGGILLATDDRDYSTNGMNALTAALGIGPFTGNYGGAFPLDQGHPLTSEPNTIAALSNDTTTSQAPFGLQPNGRTLRTIGYHSGVTTNPGISTTIDGGVLGITVEIAEAGGVLCEGTRTFLASITSGDQFGPFTYEWRVDNVVVGTGTTYTFDADAVSSGTYEVKVIAQGAGQRADDDIAVMTVGGAACGCGFDAESVCDDGGAVIAIALEGPVPNQFVVCRLISAGQGSPPASTDELRCEDADGDGVADLFDGATLTSQFGIGFCGIP